MILHVSAADILYYGASSLASQIEDNRGMNIFCAKSLNSATPFLKLGDIGTKQSVTVKNQGSKVSLFKTT